MFIWEIQARQEQILHKIKLCKVSHPKSTIITNQLLHKSLTKQKSSKYLMQSNELALPQIFVFDG